jgi:NADH-quinone oxidoreductase subunit C
VTPREVLGRVVALVPDATALPLAEMRGQAVVTVPRERLLDALRTWRDDPETRFEQLSDVTAVDYLGRTPRFEVVYQVT